MTTLQAIHSSISSCGLSHLDALRAAVKLTRMIAMGIIGLFVMLLMVAGGAVVLTGFVGLVIVTTIFIRQRIRERKENSE